MTTIYRSPLSAPELFDVDLLTLLFSNPYAAKPTQPIYIDAETGQSHTYQQVKQRTETLSEVFRQYGIHENDVVALFSPNSIQYPIVTFAVLACGATLSPMSSALTSNELHGQLKTCRARYLVVHPSLLETAKEAVNHTAVEGLFQINVQVEDVSTLGIMEEVSPKGPKSLSPTAPPTPLDKTAFICFSSGTTGAAKGVMITHRNLVSNLQQWEQAYYKSSPPSRACVNFLPFSHIYGLSVAVCGAMFRGQKLAILSKFDYDTYLRAIQTYKVQELHLVPPIALRIVKEDGARRFDLSCVRLIMSAAAPMSAELGKALEQVFFEQYGTEVHCHQSWGLTETSPLATAVPRDNMAKRRTVGCIIPHMEFRFVNPETMQDVPRDPTTGISQPGEIICRGPNVTPGYIHNEEATTSAFYEDEQGHRWFRTGDVAVIDKEGFITIRDRLKEMIKYKGLQVIPSELEGHLQEYPGITDCAVTSWYDEEQATELPVAFIVPKPDLQSKCPIDFAADVHKWLNPRIAQHKRLRGGIYIVDTIPKNPSGKILRRQLKDLLKKKKAKDAKM